MNPMLDLGLILITGPMVGAYLGICLSIIERRKHESILDTSFNPWEFITPDRDSMNMWREVTGEARRDLLKMADKALQNCPDVSCDSVAEAFGLSKLSVRRLSKGHKGNKVTYYQPFEIRNLAKEGSV